MKPRLLSSSCSNKSSRRRFGSLHLHDPNGRTAPSVYFSQGLISIHSPPILFFLTLDLLSNVHDTNSFSASHITSAYILQSANLLSASATSDDPNPGRTSLTRSSFRHSSL